MLFVQCITLRYEKDVRYANYANQRRSIKFWKLPDVKPPENEIIFSNVYLYQTVEKINCCRNDLKSFGNECFDKDGPVSAVFSGRIAVAKEDPVFKIKYCRKKELGSYKTKIILNPNEYGRIIFNQRGTYSDTGIWYYDLIIYNFVNAGYTAFHDKIFFRKTPEHEFTDMRYLRYS